MDRTDLIPCCQIAMERLKQYTSDKNKKKMPDAYRNEYVKFIIFVHDNHDNPDAGLETGDDLDGRIITRQNVDQYYMLSVVERTGLLGTVNRIHQGLQWACSRIESPKGKFRVHDGGVVAAAIQIQQDNNGVRANTDNAGTDPHKGIKDVMPESDVVKLLKYIYQSRADSCSLAMNVNWGMNAGLRGASSRILVLSDLYTSTGFGPQGAEFPNNRTLFMILRPGQVHKDRYDTARMVGAQRHKDYRRCAVFATALRLMQLLTSHPPISFLHQNKEQRASWWDIKIGEFLNLDAESAAMRDVYLATNVSNSKVTHHRTQAVQYAGSQGLRPDQVCTMTKHIRDKYDTAYAPEGDVATMKVMSGFALESPRFLAREHIVLERDDDWYCELLLPDYRRWKQEARSRDGDKSSCCVRFLYDIIPWLVRVLVQDGIYFTAEFRTHPMARWLKNRIPQYEFWARQKRTWCEELERTRSNQEMESLPANIQVVVGGLRNEVDALKQLCREMKDSIQNLVEVVRYQVSVHNRHELSTRRQEQVVVQIRDYIINHPHQPAVPPGHHHHQQQQHPAPPHQQYQPQPPPPQPPHEQQNQHLPPLNQQPQQQQQQQQQHPNLHQEQQRQQQQGGQQEEGPVLPQLAQQQEEGQQEPLPQPPPPPPPAAAPAAAGQPAQRQLAVARAENARVGHDGGYHGHGGEESDGGGGGRFFLNQEAPRVATVNETLRSDPRQPPIDIRYPKTWAELVHIWDVRDLQEFSSAKMHGWDSRVKTAFTKIRRGMGEIYRKRAEIVLSGRDISVIDTAKLLDSEREQQGISMTKQLESLKQANRDIIKRQGKQGVPKQKKRRYR